MPQPQIGCANQRNLALMIDAPEDLVVGRPLGAGDGQRDPPRRYSVITKTRSPGFMTQRNLQQQKNSQDERIG